MVYTTTFAAARTVVARLLCTIDESLLMEGFGRVYPTSKQGGYTTYGLAARD